MPFQRFVESGRIAYVSDGSHQGKLVAIVDIIDQNRVLVDGPLSGVPRGAMRLNQLHLTKFRIRFPYTGSTSVVRKAWVAGNINELWNNSMWCRKVKARQTRHSLDDFSRFRLRKVKQIRNKLRTEAFLRLKKKAKKTAKPAAGSKAPEKVAEKK